MIFNRSQFQYTPGPRPFVLALSSDVELSEIRARPFLTSLLARGIIDGFQFADRKLKSMGWHKDFAFTHVWCHRNVSTAQYRFLRRHKNVPIVYDIDDLMMAVPDFVKERPYVVERIRWCLTHAAAVTTSTDILKAHLRDQVPSTTPIMTLKNGHGGVTLPSPPRVQKRIVWTSGDHPFITRDDPQFVSRLAHIAGRNDYEVVMIGRFDPALRSSFQKWRHIQRLDFNSYRELLRYFPGAIGLAPLPSGLSPRNQQFFDAKSDIKLVDYLSSGIVPVCTATPPYARSELFIPELAAQNSRELLQALESCINDHAGWIKRLNSAHAGALAQRRFSELSRSLDAIFRQEANASAAS